MSKKQRHNSLVKAQGHILSLVRDKNADIEKFSIYVCKECCSYHISYKK